MNPRNAVLIGDALTRLRDLPDESIDCVITSPPYFGLRDYGVSRPARAGDRGRRVGETTSGPSAGSCIEYWLHMARCG